jgi:formylmethanofuran dehydrogenase subunit E
MVLLKCHRCGYEWNYQGRSEWYACCPRCKTNVKIGGKAESEPKPQPKKTEPSPSQVSTEYEETAQPKRFGFLRKLKSPKKEQPEKVEAVSEAPSVVCYVCEEPTVNPRYVEGKPLCLKCFQELKKLKL